MTDYKPQPSPSPSVPETQEAERLAEEYAKGIPDYCEVHDVPMHARNAHLAGQVVGEKRERERGEQERRRVAQEQYEAGRSEAENERIAELEGSLRFLNEQRDAEARSAVVLTTKLATLERELGEARELHTNAHQLWEKAKADAEHWEKSTGTMQDKAFDLIRERDAALKERDEAREREKYWREQHDFATKSLTKDLEHYRDLWSALRSRLERQLVISRKLYDHASHRRGCPYWNLEGPTGCTCGFGKIEEQHRAALRGAAPSEGGTSG